MIIQKQGADMTKDWWPSKEQYDPKLTKDDWLVIFNNRELCQEKWLHILARYYEYGGIGSCSEIEDYYDEPRFTYNIQMTNFANKLVSANKCDYVDDNGHNTYFPIMFWGRPAEKNELGSYIWRLRDELRDALEEFDIVSWDQKYLLRELVDRYKTLIKKTNNTIFIDDELYKWEYITDNQNARPLSIIDYLIKNNMNIYDRVRDSQSWKTMMNDNPKALEEVILKLKDENVSLNERLSNFKSDMKALYKGYSFGSYANDERTAACFLSCWDPQKYTLYKDGDLYEPLCSFLGIPKKSAGQKYEHYLEITNVLSQIVREDADIQNVFSAKTSGYVQSDLLIAQTIIWCVFSKEGRTMLYGQIRDYWSGGVLWDSEDKTDDFINNDYWEIKWKDRNVSSVAKQVWANFGRIKTGDYFALHRYEQEILTIHYLAEVTDKDSENGIVHLKKLPQEDYYKGVAPKMKKGRWSSDLLQVVGSNVINTIFNIDKEETIMLPEKIVEYGSVLNYKKNVILQGAPGTGKTYSTAALALYIIGQKEPESIEGLDYIDHSKVMERYESYRSNGQIEFCTFHQSMDYEDFVEGLRPKLADNGTSVTYEVKPGIFKEMCSKAISAATGTTDAEEKNYVLIIDEINRGYVSKIFGELITLLEKDKRIGAEHPISVTLPYSNEDFGVPANLYIIGTMNTTDRTTGTLDYALRRRFDFITIEADPTVLDSSVAEARLLFEDVKSFINNTKLEDMDISDLMIGHSYFMAGDKLELQRRIRYEVIPLVKEYIKDGILNCLPSEANEFFEDWLNLSAHIKE